MKSDIGQCVSTNDALSAGLARKGSISEASRALPAHLPAALAVR